ncbi:MAG: hypothetical protein AB7N76_19015 [Planctomycetota bacterium]
MSQRRGDRGPTALGTAKGIAGGLGALVIGAGGALLLVFLLFAGLVALKHEPAASPALLIGWGLYVGLPMAIFGLFVLVGLRRLRRDLGLLATDSDAARRSARKAAQEAQELSNRLDDLASRFDRTSRFLDELSARVDRNMSARQDVDHLRAELAELAELVELVGAQQGVADLRSEVVAEFELVRKQVDELLGVQRRELSGIAQDVARLRAGRAT